MGACRFYIYSCATSIMIGSLSCVFTLQSSVQAENGTGALSLAAYYISAIVSATIVYPFLLRFLGRKYNLLLGDISCIVFGLTLLLPSHEVPIAVNAVTGIFACSLWSAAFAIAVSFGLNEMGINSNKKEDGAKNSGCFVAILSFGQSLINLLPEATLRNFGTETTDNVRLNATTNFSCGAQDCPNEYSAQEDHPIYNNLVPSRTTLYIFVGVLALLQVVVLVVHCALLPNDYPTRLEETPLIAHRDGAENNKRKLYKDVLKPLKDSLLTIWGNALSAVGAFTFASQIQYGLISGFVWLVFTRSFVSCISGVQEVGFFMLIFYLSSATASFLAAKCFTSIPVRLITTTRLVFDVATCIVAIIWIPSHDTFYLMYIISVLLGICQGLSKTLAYALPVTYFKDIDAGYTLCVCWDAIGVAIMGILSVKVCTSYIIFTAMFASVVSTSSLLIGTRGKDSSRDCKELP